jgi:hypothetical protein
LHSGCQCFDLLTGISATQAGTHTHTHTHTLHTHIHTHTHTHTYKSRHTLKHFFGWRPLDVADYVTYSLDAVLAMPRRMSAELLRSLDDSSSDSGGAAVDAAEVVHEMEAGEGAGAAAEMRQSTGSPPKETLVALW